MIHTGTVQLPANPSKPLTQKEARALRRRIKNMGWSQNEAARQIGKAPGLFSRWLRGEFSSAPIRLAIAARLAEVEGDVEEPRVSAVS